jgi:hypothetical protein
VEDSETPVETPAMAAAPRRRRAPARRKTSPPKRPAGRRTPSRRSRARLTSKGLAALLDGLAAKAAAAGKEMKTLSGQGTGAARRALRDAGAASRRTIARLTKEWERMDARRRARFVAALLAALAAASAPIVRSRLKK